MPFIYRNLTLSLGGDEEALPSLVATLIGIKPADLRDFHIVRKGVDARRKHRVKIIYTLAFSVSDSEALRTKISVIPDLEWQNASPVTQHTPVFSKQRIVIVGSGPAGLFTALRLAEYGLTLSLIHI